MIPLEQAESGGGGNRTRVVGEAISLGTAPEKRVCGSPIERLMPRLVLTPENCWLWTGTKNNHGYGRISVGRRSEGTRRSEFVYRITFEHFRNEVPAGLEIDHLCRNRACCNPWHLEAVTHRENSLRGNAPSVVLHRANVCSHGHSLHDAYTRGSGARQCRECKKAYERAAYWRRKRARA